MKKIPLTQGKFALVDDEDFEYLSQWKWHCVSQKGMQYAARNIKENGCKKIQKRMHRYLITDGILVDHMDGDGLNNQRENLRPATYGQNSANRKTASSNKIGLKGVREMKGLSVRAKRYTAQIRKDNHVYHLGSFFTAEEAHEAYKKAALELHGVFARW